jgi:predicted PurR-regulated permease PerM
MTIPNPVPTSPKWSPMTKMVVGISLIALAAALFIQFRTIVGPLIMAFILAFVLHPLIARFSTAAKISWRTAVNLVYLFLLILLVGLITLAGLAIIQQIQSLVGFVQNYVTNLPAIIADLSQQVYRIGPFVLDLTKFDLPALTSQLLGAVQGLLGRVTGIVSTLATSAASTLGWTLFVLVISYFLLADTGRVSSPGLVHIEVPGYEYDLRRLTQELKRIWNAFLRGQLIIILLVIGVYTILMSIMGMRFAFGIALLAGVARFVPYLGPLILWIVIFLVGFFQGGNHFGMAPTHFVVLVLVVAILTDQIFDNLVSPRFMGQTLGVHPAAVLVAAIIAARLIGLIGLILAAPSLATIILFGRYIVRKMFDMEPFPEEEEPAEVDESPWTRGAQQLRIWWRSIQRR